MSISAQQPPTQRSGLRPTADGAGPLEATPPATSRFPLATAEPVRWTEAAVALVGLGAAAAGATWLHPGWDGLTWAVAILAAEPAVLLTWVRPAPSLAFFLVFFHIYAFFIYMLVLYIYAHMLSVYIYVHVYMQKIDF